MMSKDRAYWGKVAQPQVFIGFALMALMAMTRGQHFASIDALPSASWAVFFIAGVYLTSHWSFSAFMAGAVLLDVSSLAAGTSISDCITPSYVALIPAYACLWLAGRWFAKNMTFSGYGLMRLVVATMAGLMLAQLISSGSYYLFSGKFEDPNLSDFIDRILAYTPPRLESFAFYVGLAACIHLMADEVRRFGEWAGYTHE